MWLCACHDDVCKLEVNLESVLSFHYVSPRDYTQVIRLGGRGPYVLSQSDCPGGFFLNIYLIFVDPIKKV